MKINKIMLLDKVSELQNDIKNTKSKTIENNIEQENLIQINESKINKLKLINIENFQLIKELMNTIKNKNKNIN